MYYKIRNTEYNVKLLHETAKECNLDYCFIEAEKDFVVCIECIMFPHEQVGLKNARMSNCEEVSDGICVLCGHDRLYSER